MSHFHQPYFAVTLRISEKLFQVYSTVNDTGVMFLAGNTEFL